MPSTECWRKMTEDDYNEMMDEAISRTAAVKRIIGGAKNNAA